MPYVRITHQFDDGVVTDIKVGADDVTHPDLLDELALARTDRVLGDRPEIERLDAAELSSLAPVAPGAVVGGALLPYDLQVDPREAADAIRRHLAA